MTNKTVRFNGEDFSDIVEMGTYHTEIIPIERVITTLDGVDNIAYVGDHYTLSFNTNHMTTERYEALCRQMQNGKVNVQFTVLQTGTTRTMQMKYDGLFADFMEKCKYLGKEWIAGMPITMVGPVR